MDSSQPLLENLRGLREGILNPKQCDIAKALHLFKWEVEGNCSLGGGSTGKETQSFGTGLGLCTGESLGPSLCESIEELGIAH